MKALINQDLTLNRTASAESFEWNGIVWNNINLVPKDIRQANLIYDFIGSSGCDEMHTITATNYVVDTVNGTVTETPTIAPKAAAELAVITQAKIDANIGALWQAAHDYEYAQISGVAVGLLVLGVLQAKPKAIAVQQWSQAIWTLYYTRKPSITEVHDEAMQDFSSVGPIPHSIPELMVELGL